MIKMLEKQHGERMAVMSDLVKAIEGKGKGKGKRKGKSGNKSSTESSDS